MENYTIETLPEYFRFVLEPSRDGVVFHATYPNDYGFKNNNVVFVGWIKDNEPRATSYLIHHALELVNCGSWRIL